MAITMSQRSLFLITSDSCFFFFFNYYVTYVCHHVMKAHVKKEVRLFPSQMTIFIIISHVFIYYHVADTYIHCRV